MAKSINSIGEIINNYKYFIIDLWGVIHDGTNIYLHAKDTLELLKSENKKVLFLSNSPRRSITAKEYLKNFGIGEDLYYDILTSGEFAYNNIQDLFKGKDYFHIGPELNQNLFKELGYHEVEDLQKADFILTTGLLNYLTGIDKEFVILNEARKLNLPMLCANPDIRVVTQNGKEFLCAGAVAKEYEKIGGKVIFVGKPYMPIYEEAQKMLNADKKHLIAIGDSLNTDIKGANNFGIDNLLITSGIHINELKTSSMDLLFSKYNQISKYYITYLK